MEPSHPGLEREANVRLATRLKTAVVLVRRIVRRPCRSELRLFLAPPESFCLSNPFASIAPVKIRARREAASPSYPRAGPRSGPQSDRLLALPAPSAPLRPPAPAPAWPRARARARFWPRAPEPTRWRRLDHRTVPPTCGRRRRVQTRVCDSMGSSDRQISMACGQRVWNLQPGGGLVGLGISPSSFCACPR